MTEYLASSRPLGKDSVMGALVDATIELIVEEGLNLTVRQIATRAEVNHGLVHAYFGNKDGLIAAAVETLVERASAQRDTTGFPPPDLASRRDGELAKAIARIRLDGGANLFPSHPVLSSWQAALGDSRPDLPQDEVDAMIATSSALGLGWALFADHLCETLELDDVGRKQLDERIARLASILGGIPDDAGGQPRDIARHPLLESDDAAVS